MVLANFQVKNKLWRARFFQQTFLLADISLELVLEMLFLTLTKADMWLSEQKLTWNSYTIAEALPTIKRVEFIDKKKSSKAALDQEWETFVVYVAALEAPLAEVLIYSDRETQIAFLIVEEVKILIKYSDFADFFSEEKTWELSKQTKLNKHAIELENYKQLLYKPTYSLEPIELERLKTYIETHLKTGFIRPSKSPAGAPILFYKKPDGSLWLYVNYQGLNKLTIKN